MLLICKANSLDVHSKVFVILQSVIILRIIVKIARHVQVRSLMLLGTSSPGIISCLSLLSINVPSFICLPAHFLFSVDFKKVLIHVNITIHMSKSVVCVQRESSTTLFSQIIEKLFLPECFPGDKRKFYIHVFGEKYGFHISRSICGPDAVYVSYI